MGGGFCLVAVLRGRVHVAARVGCWLVAGRGGVENEDGVEQRRQKPAGGGLVSS